MGDACGPFDDLASTASRAIRCRALRQQALRQRAASVPGDAPSRYLDALLAKPAERSAKAREMLQTQPMIAAHPLVSGNEGVFTPHRPPRPEKSEGGRRASSSCPSTSPMATSRPRSPNWSRA